MCGNRVWLLSVRDTGIGMDTSQIPGWGRLHVSEAITRLHADGTPARGLEEGASDNPFYGSGLLHFAGVGGKSAAMAVSARDGYVDVLSLGVDAGDTVVNLQLHKEVARESSNTMRCCRWNGASPSSTWGRQRRSLNLALQSSSATCLCRTQN